MDALVHTVLSGEVEHRAVQAFLAQLAQELEAIHTRHHDVQDVGIWVYLAGNAQRLVAGIGAKYLEVLELQRYGKQLHNIGFVIDDKNLGEFSVFHVLLRLP